jgi:exodeoxyribonuclease VII large subunit
MPSTIGIVTSLQAAALRDVLTTLRRRAPYCRIVVYPVPVQGDSAARAIASMLVRASARAEVDVLLLVRGGGSIEDLWSFNDEAVARGIRASAIPVIVGIGHESDYTIADFAADLRAPTPTAAAEVVAPDAADLDRAVAARAQRLRGVLKSRLGAWSQQLDYAVRALSTPRAPLAGLRSRVAHHVLRTSRVASSRASAGRIALAARSERLRKNRPDIGAERQAVRDRMSAIARFSHTIAHRAAARLERLCAELAHLDPKAVLTRGYSIVRDADGRLVTNAGQLSIGQAIGVVLAAGGAQARVEQVTPPAQVKDP